MLYEIKVPEAGFSVTEGQLSSGIKTLEKRCRRGRLLFLSKPIRSWSKSRHGTRGLIEIKHEVGEIVPTARYWV